MMSLNGGIRTLSRHKQMLLKGCLLTSAGSSAKSFFLGHKKREVMTHSQGGGNLYNHKKQKHTKNFPYLKVREILILNTCIHTYVCAKNSLNICEMALSSLNVSSQG